MSHYSKNKGFTLIELLVSLGIMSVILTVVVLNQSIYTDGIALVNLADEISSTISQAQVYGVGVRGLSNDFSVSYGVTFSIRTSPPDSGSNVAYLNFADKGTPPNKFYDGDWLCVASECLGKVDITRGNYIEKLCVVRNPGADICNNNVGRVDISFARPSTEAQILFFKDNGSSYDPGNIIGARIELKSPGGATRSVTVYNTGQVSVQ
jgi:prepilin-type N-terminal cleavage/methylation domain-containing protein